MLTKVQPERFFIGSLTLAFVSLILATVGIKSQLFQNIQYLILLFASLSVIWIGFKAGKFIFITNRLRKQALGWLIAAIFSATLWLFAQKDIQSIFPVLKGYRKVWNTFESFALFATVVCILLVSLTVLIIGFQIDRKSVV